VVTSPTQSAEGDAERLLARLYETGRHTSGRLMDHPFAPLAPAPAPDSELALVDAILREGSRTERTDHLQASLQIAGRQWASAAATIEVLRALDPDDPQIANDLGVVYLERGGVEPPYLVDALRLFEFASSIDPLAPEPIFNLALTYRRLHLDEVADGLLSEYQRIDPGSAWLEDIASEVDEAEPGATIRRVPEFSLSAMEEDPDQWWDLVFETALYLDEGRSAPATAPAEFLTAYESRTTDRTLSGIFGPLASPARNTIIAFRRTIQQARTLYAQARFAESIQILEGALPTHRSRPWSRSTVSGPNSS
jgi:tetratricopeptide (TPR) repeat protein